MSPVAEEGGRGRAITFVAANYATTWFACLILRPKSAAGAAWPAWVFIFVTVWSPTLLALLISLILDGVPGVRNLFSRLFRRLSPNKLWYVMALLLPAAVVFLAILVARQHRQSAPFIPPAALPVIVALQLCTGATGEELGWRGFLLPQLQTKLGLSTSAIVMGILWGLWHLPSFFFPGMPQTLIPPLAFLLAVFGLAIFLALLFNETNGHVLSTMLAHFSFNLSLAVGGARFSATLWWSLALLLLAVAIWSAVKLSALK